MLVENFKNDLPDFRRMERLSAVTGTFDDMQDRRHASGRQFCVQVLTLHQRYAGVLLAVHDQKRRVIFGHLVKRAGLLRQLW